MADAVEAEVEARAKEREAAAQERQRTNSASVALALIGITLFWVLLTAAQGGFTWTPKLKSATEVATLLGVGVSIAVVVAGGAFQLVRTGAWALGSFLFVAAMAEFVLAAVLWTGGEADSHTLGLSFVILSLVIYGDSVRHDPSGLAAWQKRDASFRKLPVWVQFVIVYVGFLAAAFIVVLIIGNSIATALVIPAAVTAFMALVLAAFGIQALVRKRRAHQPPAAAPPAK